MDSEIQHVIERVSFIWIAIELCTHPRPKTHGTRCLASKPEGGERMLDATNGEQIRMQKHVSIT